MRFPALRAEQGNQAFLHPFLLCGGRRHSIRSAIPHGFKTSFEQRCQCPIYFVMHIIVLALEASRRLVGRPCTQ